MIIDNIVTNEKIKDDKYYICDNIKDINPNFPTLIIGWSLVKEIYGENKVSILNKKINEKTFWTFNSKERKVDLEIDVINFQKKCLQYIETKINYIFIDILHDNKKKIKKILKKIYSLNNIISFVDNEIIYIYDENLVFGVDLNILNFVGINIKKIMDKVNKISTLTLSENEIFNKCIRCVENNNKKIIPYIYRYGTTDKNNHTSFIRRR